MARNLMRTAPDCELASCRISGDDERKLEQDHKVCGDHGSEAHRDHETKANRNRQCLHCFCGCEIELRAVSRDEEKTDDALLGAQAPACAEFSFLQGELFACSAKGTRRGQAAPEEFIAIPDIRVPRSLLRHGNVPIAVKQGSSPTVPEFQLRAN
jgi:hypothetical protein